MSFGGFPFGGDSFGGSGEEDAGLLLVAPVPVLGTTTLGVGAGVVSSAMVPVGSSTVMAVEERASSAAAVPVGAEMTLEAEVRFVSVTVVSIDGVTTGTVLLTFESTGAVRVGGATFLGAGPRDACTPAAAAIDTARPGGAVGAAGTLVTSPEGAAASVTSARPCVGTTPGIFLED